MSPLSLTREVLIRDPARRGGGIFVAKLAQRLRKEKAESLDVRPDGLSFNGFSFTGALLKFRSRWNRLASISYGLLCVRTEGSVIRARYTLVFSHLFVISVLAAAWFGIIAYVAPPNRVGSLCRGVEVFFLMLIAFFGGNVVIADVRFRRMLRSTWLEVESEGSGNEGIGGKIRGCP